MARPSTCAWVRAQCLIWVFFFHLDRQWNPPTHSPGAFQMPSTLDPPPDHAGIMQLTQALGWSPSGGSCQGPTDSWCHVSSLSWNPSFSFRQQALLALIVLVPLVSSDPPHSLVSRAEEKSEGLRACRARGRGFCSRWPPEGRVVAGALLISTVGNWLECLMPVLSSFSGSAKTQACSGGGRS